VMDHVRACKIQEVQFATLAVEDSLAMTVEPVAMLRKLAAVGEDAHRRGPVSATREGREHRARNVRAGTERRASRGATGRRVRSTGAALRTGAVSACPVSAGRHAIVARMVSLGTTASMYAIKA